MTLSGARLQQIARDTAASLNDVSRGRPFTPHLDVWKVRGKVFLIVTEDDPDLQIITVKIDPPYGDALRRDHATIVPGHYLDKQHWISIGPGAGITPELIEDLIYTSYDLAGGLKPERS
ncbi:MULTISPECIES: MmcQ/YjbR family DNA-binding protein [Arthrobacter]|uniref:MmcQ/YjbR family DNA-binding protein n=1 Tax=Arthrobacter sunyaminii TaxID=2816859 RepID=A0A975PCT1_9MICC|nr:MULTISPECIES: MmcQ/YjbR family DNA-binding protein [Arthrobacter]MBO0895814.1 MmcQ/YjbR family DNA-binding protein [Arthrobacter sunyaminii]MBO0907468.1 MmcQ/YjbR family DNA-binding protein [Arthrobacter sunyaminii]QWQ35046.1 MmcQ/YjbR family DNA-binding protein [Arthrobacter sunyaminii]